MSTEIIVMYDSKEKKDVEIYVDVYTLEEMTRIMGKTYSCLFLIDAIGKIFSYSEQKMNELMHEFSHCFLWDRKVMMIDE